MFRGGSPLPSEVDLLGETSMAASDFEVPTNGSETVFSVVLRVTLSHPDKTTEVQVDIPVTVKNADVPPGVIDNFEDGEETSSTGLNWNDWVVDQGESSDWVVDSGTVLEGSYSGRLSVNGNRRRVILHRDTPAQPDSISASFRLDKIPANWAQLQISDDDLRIAGIFIKSDGTLQAFDDSVENIRRADTGETISAGTTYTMTADFDWANETWDLYLDGTLIYSDSPMPSNPEVVKIRHEFTDDTSNQFWIDAIESPLASD